LFVDNRKLTDNYRNFTFKRTYFIVVLQQHSSSKTTQTERVGVGEAPNTHYLIFITTSPNLYLEQQQTRKRPVGRAVECQNTPNSSS
jgi:hypothetical protein